MRDVIFDVIIVCELRQKIGRNVPEQSLNKMCIKCSLHLKCLRCLEKKRGEILWVSHASVLYTW